MEALLLSLECPLSYPDKDSFRSIVVWLEDRKIRYLEESQRAGLKACNNGDDDWDKVFDEYLRELGSPFQLNELNRLMCLNWLISYAISLEYEDCIEQGIHQQEENTNIKSETEDIEVHMETDLTSPYGHLIDELGKEVHLTRSHGEADEDFLQRIAQYTRLYLKEGSLKALSAAKSSTESNTELLHTFPLVFDAGDSTVNYIALVLRMLHLFDLRELQHDLNALLALGQGYTANPRTNASLGKVGR